MSRRIIAIMIVLVLLAPGALAQYWDQDSPRPVVCCDDRPGCQVLQMVMLGSFAILDVQQRLDVRIFSAAYPQLASVSEADVRHFVESFGAAEETLRTAYYIALANCLWADILMGEKENQQEEEARQVLLLFLDPSAVPNARQQMELIRLAADEKVYAELAERTELPPDFIRYLMETDNWQEGMTAD